MWLLQAVDCGASTFLCTQPSSYVTAAEREMVGHDAAIFSATRQNLMARLVPYVMAGSGYISGPTETIIHFTCRNGFCPGNTWTRTGSSPENPEGLLCRKHSSLCL